MINYDIEQRRHKKMHSDHRIINLKIIDGKTGLSSSGLVDNRLFNGENKLNATFSYTTGMWKLHYDMGGLPGGLQNNFTTFSELLIYVKDYFRKRNVEVTDVIDAH